MNDTGISAAILGGLIIGGILSTNLNKKKVEKYTGYPKPPQFYANAPKFGLRNFKSPSPNDPNSVMNLQNTGDQLFAYQLFQQATNAATATMEQLDAISGQSQQQTGDSSLDGGLSSRTAPYAILDDQGPELYASEFQAVNLGSERAQSISACAQNAPTFVATSLLPKPTIPGQDSWNVPSPDNLLVNQSFLSATQQIGIDTTLSSTKNQSYDIRNNIPNPINVVSPWNNTEIMPDLEKRPLDCFIPKDQGLYGCGSPGANTNPTYVGM